METIINPIGGSIMANQNVFDGAIHNSTRRSLNSKAARYLQLKAEKKLIEREMQELSADIIGSMQNLGVDPSQSLQLDDHDFKYVVAVRQSWDSEKLMAKLKAHADDYRNTTEYQRLYIS